MTLTRLKYNFKLVGVVALFSVYSIGLFLVGKNVTTKSDVAPSPVQTDEKVTIQKPLPQDNTQSTRVLSSYVKLCSNTVHSFELAYPRDWFTTYNQKDYECTFFAPFSFLIPNSPQEDFVPITVRVVNKDDWPETVKSFENPTELYNITKTQNLQIAGRPVKLIELESTGSIKPRGFIKVAYLVFDSNQPLEITYTQLQETEKTDDTKNVLRDMVESLKFY